MFPNPSPYPSNSPHSSNSTFELMLELSLALQEASTLCARIAASLDQDASEVLARRFAGDATLERILTRMDDLAKATAQPACEIPSSPVSRPIVLPLFSGEIDNRFIAELDLQPHIIQTLTDGKLVTIQDVIDSINAGEFHLLHNVGPVALQITAAALRKLGYDVDLTHYKF